MITFEFENGQTLQMKSLGHALEHASVNKTRIVRSY